MEDIKLLVQEEGRSARNLVAFNVPVIETQCDSSSGKLMKKPPTSPRSLSEFRKDELKCKRSRDSSQSGSRVRSASTGRDKKSELHARYWAFLFGNLQRAVDEIYQTCETDESVTECKEVIMVLDNYTREFRNLINWFKIKWEYETTPPPQRPRSLAWEIRKSSPGKIRHRSDVTNISPGQKFCSISPLSLQRNDDYQLNTDKQSKVNEKTEDISGNRISVPALQKISTICTVPEASSDSLSNCELILPNIPSVQSNPDPFKNPTIVESEEEKSWDNNSNVPDDSGLKVETSSSKPLKVDEICQTDPEKDVDENGPKFISSGQQTCSDLTGFVKDKEDSYHLPVNQVNKTGGISVPKNSKTSEDEARTSGKLTSPVGNHKTGLSNSVSNPAPIKLSHQNSYSCATTGQSKVLNSVQTARTTTFGRLQRSFLNNKVSVTSIQKQTSRVRPMSSISGRSETLHSPAAKLIRTKDTQSSNLSGVQNRVKQESSDKKIKPSVPSEKDSNSVQSKECNKALKSLNTSYMKRGVGDFVGNNSDDNSNEEDDGWVKVRSRSRFSPATRSGDLETTLSKSASNLKSKGDQKVTRMIYKTRFHQPSSAVSLPTLAFSTRECKENITVKKLVKTKTVTHNKSNENLKITKKIDKNKMEETNNKKKLFFDKEKKNLNRLLNEKNLNKTVNNSKHSAIEKAENEKNINLSKLAVEDFGKTTPLDQDAIDEDENHFDEEIKKNKETEEMLQKEIKDLEAADLEVDLETGDEETDGEATTGTEEEGDQEKKRILSPSEKDISLPRKHRDENVFSGISWAEHMDTLDELEKLVVQDCSKTGMTKDEQMDTLERLEEFVARHPGRALELHQKLSSPSRRRTMLETVKRFQARQAKASAKREQLKMEKAQKLRELLKKVDEVKAAKDKLIEERRQRLEMKLKKAAENRNLHLQEIMRKAHDEEEKLKEIAFINELEAQNKRHDFMTQCQEQEGRLQGIHEERQRKQEEKAAKEAAFEERRKAIEAERQEKLEKLQERQRKRDEQADKKKQEKEKERQELAREKARDRSERLEALHAAQLEAQEELQKKIQQKQEDYARRHEENIEQIRQKALELSILKCSDDIAPKLAPYDVQKLCTACNVLIGSEVYLLSHIRGKKHQEAVKSQVSEKDLSKEELERYNIKIIVNAPDKVDPKITLDHERLKSFKKKSKKIRLKMITKGEEYISKLETANTIDSPGKGKLQKCLKDIERVIKAQGKGQWSDNAITTLERSMGEIIRLLNKQCLQDQLVLRLLNGFEALDTILQLDMEVPPNMTPYIPQKCFVTASSAYLAAVKNCASNCKFVILSNYVITLLDLLMKRLTVLIPERTTVTSAHHSKSSLPFDSIASILLRLFAEILHSSEDTKSDTSREYIQRLEDIISYTVSSGIVDKLTKYCKSVRDPVDDQPAGQFLLNILELLTILTKRCKTVRQGDKDPTQFLTTLQVTELVGAVSILYGMLLHQGSPPRMIDANPPTLSPQIIAIAVGTMRFLRSVAELDLQMFQSILGAEGISLQFRHIASYLLWYCCQDREKVLLHEVIAVVGYFAVFHRDNQMILQSGSTPTVLQQLCNLPFPYFSNPELSALLFPTLLACCCDNEENKAILQQEISYSLLADFLESKVAIDHPLVGILSSKLSPSKNT